MKADLTPRLRERLLAATEGLSGEAYTEAFKKELAAIAKDVATPETILNKLIAP